MIKGLVVWFRFRVRAISALVVSKIGWSIVRARLGGSGQETKVACPFTEVAWPVGPSTVKMLESITASSLVVVFLIDLLMVSGI